MLKLRPYRPADAATIVSWIADEYSFRQWCADRYDHYPITAADPSIVSKYNVCPEGVTLANCCAPANCGHAAAINTTAPVRKIFFIIVLDFLYKVDAPQSILLHPLEKKEVKNKKKMYFCPLSLHGYKPCKGLTIYNIYR